MKIQKGNKNTLQENRKIDWGNIIKSKNLILHVLLIWLGVVYILILAVKLF